VLKTLLSAPHRPQSELKVGGREGRHEKAPLGEGAASGAKWGLPTEGIPRLATLAAYSAGPAGAFTWVASPVGPEELKQGLDREGKLRPENGPAGVVPHDHHEVPLCPVR